MTEKKPLDQMLDAFMADAYDLARITIQLQHQIDGRRGVGQMSAAMLLCIYLVASSQSEAEFNTLADDVPNFLKHMRTLIKKMKPKVFNPDGTPNYEEAMKDPEVVVLQHSAERRGKPPTDFGFLSNHLKPKGDKDAS